MTDLIVHVSEAETSCLSHVFTSYQPSSDSPGTREQLHAVMLCMAMFYPLSMYWILNMRTDCSPELSSINLQCILH